MAKERPEEVIWLDSDPEHSESNEEVDQQQDSGSDRDTHFNPLSSPTLPANLATNFDRIAQAEFEEAVADGSYVAGPDFEWESEDAREGL